MDLKDQMLHQLVFQALSVHPLPWRIESDWTEEVVDAKGSLVLKCWSTAVAEGIIKLAEEIQSDLDKTDKELEDQGFPGSA